MNRYNIAKIFIDAAEEQLLTAIFEELEYREYPHINPFTAIYQSCMVNGGLFGEFFGIPDADST